MVYLRPLNSNTLTTSVPAPPNGPTSFTIDTGSFSAQCDSNDDAGTFNITLNAVGAGNCENATVTEVGSEFTDSAGNAC